jgi:hypothetical protein
MSFNSVRSELAVLACACSLLLPIAASAQEQSVWFSIVAMRNGQLSIDPIAKVAEHELIDTPDACAETDSEYVSFAGRCMKPGKSYQVLFGGVPVGKVILGSNESPGYLLTPMEYSGIMRPHGCIQALTTSVPPLTERRRTRQAPTGEERNLAMQLPRTLFVRAGVANSLLEKIKVENLTRTIVAAATSPSVIGSFSFAAADFATSGIVHNLFFIASVRRGN